jgi:CTD nuclear envelope phosphatase 1
MINDHPCLYHVYVRPYLSVFLRVVMEWYDVAIYTASVPEYANPVIDALCQLAGVSISPQHRFFRHHCRFVAVAGGQYLKDLTIVIRHLLHQPSLGGMDAMDGAHASLLDPQIEDAWLSKMILVDNSISSFGIHPRNGIPIEGWICDPRDEGLIDMLAVLDAVPVSYV